MEEEKQYILKKDCPRIGKEIGDSYNDEFGESIRELLEKGVIEEEKTRCYYCGEDLISNMSGCPYH